MKKIILFFAIVFLSLPYFVLSQEAGGKKILDNWSLNINGGASLFWGDIRTYPIYPVYQYENERNAAFGFIISKKLNATFELRGQFIKGNLSGTRRVLNNYFDAQFNEYTINATINFSRLIYGDDPYRKLNLYGIAGIGFVDFRSVKKRLGSNKYIISSGYSTNGTVKENMQTESVIPLGFGANYKIDSRFEINFENIWSIVNSDDIDVSRGGFKYDILSYTSLGLTYKFNFRNNPSAFGAIGRSKTKSGSLGEGGYFDEDAIKAEKDSLNDTKFKELEDKINNQDLKVKELEKKINALPAEVNIENLKKDIYNSILDTIKRFNTTISSGYMQVSILFDINKFNIKADEMGKVASIAERMKSDINLKLKIVGNTDQSGSIEYNNYLSKKRAENVYNTLINKYGADQKRLSFDGKGKDDPFSKKQYSVNRRVDFVKE